MALKLLGKANHIHKLPRGNEISTIDIKHLEFESQSDVLSDVITLGDDHTSIIINSIEQWEQIDAIVRKGFDDLS